MNCPDELAKIIPNPLSFAGYQITKLSLCLPLKFSTGGRSAGRASLWSHRGSTVPVRLSHESKFSAHGVLLIREEKLNPAYGLAERLKNVRGTRCRTGRWRRNFELVIN